MKGVDWSEDEVRATVSDYLKMLDDEIAGRKYSKAAHRRALASRVAGRSEKAIEFKYANVSAVLLDLGREFIPGYKPLSHYQALLRDEVERQLGRQGRA